ncbi:YD repeat protein [Pseudomonas syringae pv. philadelphi]|nr:YD repeat protein [Pseudomonas syringae pv. berberidis]KPY11651.1 YD repeat protein [Pseudomonas syringae pv. philadelphi]RMM18100.1 YD repeat protein [Pseudomonas syringae pv. berberidis]RMQ43006.1 YD repeat protein [Pseudomonas syringae pv. berberidis]
MANIIIVVGMKRREIIFKLLLVVAIQVLFSLTARADVYKAWRIGNFPEVSFDTPKQVCDALYYELWPHLTSLYRPENNGYDSPTSYSCGYGSYYQPKFGGAELLTLNCPDGQRPNSWFSGCTSESAKGHDDHSLSCSSPSTLAGNPINFMYGNKIQNETDFESKTMKISRFYNSSDGLWRHNFSTYLYFSDRSAVMVRADGKENLFSPGAEGYISATDVGILKKENGSWRYDGLGHQVLFFSASGDLIQVNDSQGVVYKLSYSQRGAGREILLSNDYGESVLLVESSKRQLNSVKAPKQNIIFVYDDNQNLSERQLSVGGIVSIRKYYYEDPYSPNSLTGITDERGVRFATWAYDRAGRAISSQHAGNTGAIKIAYTSDLSSIVTNELGKETTYRYEIISGVKRLVEVKGEPTPDCPASNSSYTYNDRGLVLTKTDAKGLITTYVYNDRGLEISRTEASGTTLARTTTTEWDPDRFLPIRVVEPNRVTVYSYDNQGRELTRQSTSR